MGSPVKRRELLSRFFRQENTATDFSKNDRAFKKYANKKIPEQQHRTNTGLNPYAGPWTDTEALHLLRRVTFGATKAHVDKIKGLSVSAAIDSLIDNAVLPSTTPLNSYQSVFADTQNCPAGASWVNFSAKFNDDFALTYFRTYWSFKPWWFAQMINQPAHIHEKITLFWANHFSTIAQDINYSKAVFQHFKTLRIHGLGNFRTLIKQVTIDPHMLSFQNGEDNNKFSPNENYGRELQELFTVGKDLGAAGYLESDVIAAAKVLTGWKREYDNPDGSYSSYFNPNDHDTTNKQFSAFYGNKIITGKTGDPGKDETDELIDMILQTQESAKYIVRRLYRWFVYYAIDAATEANVIVPLATIFRTNNFDIVPVLKALFKSEHFFDPLNVGCVIKSPVDMYVGMAREFALKLPAAPLETQYAGWRQFMDLCDDAGQSIGDPPNVSGWRAYYQIPVFYQDWISSDTIQRRARAINEFVNGDVYANGVRIKIDTIEFNKLLVDSVDPTKHVPSDPNKVVSNFIKYLLPKDLSDNQKIFMKNILLSNQVSDFYWTNAWNAYASAPTAGNEATVRTRLDALVNYITSLEEYYLC
jgi:uncharacterized protein (DUF1800 family)